MLLNGASASIHVTDQAEIEVSGNTAVSIRGGAGIDLQNKARAVFDSVDSVDSNKVMVRISDNKALRGKGGGMTVPTGSSVVLTSKHVFDNNFATSGGALSFVNQIEDTSVDNGDGNCVGIVVQTSKIEEKNSKSLVIETSPVSAISHLANTILKKDHFTNIPTGGKYTYMYSLFFCVF